MNRKQRRANAKQLRMIEGGKKQPTPEEQQTQRERSTLAFSEGLRLYLRNVHQSGEIPTLDIMAVLLRYAATLALDEDVDEQTFCSGASFVFDEERQNREKPKAT